MAQTSDDVLREALVALACHALGLAQDAALDAPLLEAVTEPDAALSPAVRSALIDVLEANDRDGDARRAAIERAFEVVRGDASAAALCPRHCVVRALIELDASTQRPVAVSLRRLLTLPWSAIAEEISVEALDAVASLLAELDAHLHEGAEGWIDEAAPIRDVAAPARRLRRLLEGSLRESPTLPVRRWIAEIPPEHRTDGIRWLVADRDPRGSWFLLLHESLAQPCTWDFWAASLPEIRRQAEYIAGVALEWRAVQDRR